MSTRSLRSALQSCGITTDGGKLLTVIKEEIQLISDKYGDDRRTKIGYDEFDMSAEDLIPDEDVVVAITNLGYIKRMSSDGKARTGSGKESKGMQTIDGTLKSSDDHDPPLHDVLHEHRPRLPPEGLRDPGGGKDRQERPS